MCTTGPQWSPGGLGESDMAQKMHSQGRERGGEGDKRTKAMGRARERRRERIDERGAED